MGMSTRKLTIFDTIARVRKQIAARPQKKLISESEVGDIAQAAGLNPVPIQEKTAVRWYWVKDVTKAMDNFMAQQDRIRELQALTSSPHSADPTPLAAPVATESAPVSLAENGVNESPAIGDGTDADQPGEADATDGPTAGPASSSGPDALADPDPDATVPGTLESLGLDRGTVDALKNNDIKTLTALNNLVEAGGPAALKSLDGIGEGRVKAIESALSLTAAA